MAFEIDSRRIGFAVLAVVTSAVLIWFGTGLFPMWPLLWFAPLPVLLVANRGSWRAAALTALLTWMIGNLNREHYFNSALHVPLVGRVEILVAPAIVFTIAVLLYARNGNQPLLLGAQLSARVATGIDHRTMGH